MLAFETDAACVTVASPIINKAAKNVDNTFFITLFLSFLFKNSITLRFGYKSEYYFQKKIKKVKKRIFLFTIMVYNDYV